MACGTSNPGIVILSFGVDAGPSGLIDGGGFTGCPLGVIAAAGAGGGGAAGNGACCPDDEAPPVDLGPNCEAGAGAAAILHGSIAFQ